MRLIDADMVLETCNSFKGMNRKADIGIKLVNEIVGSAPTVDAEPIRHGHWNKEEDTPFRLCVYKCSLCGGEVLSEAYLFKYCPYCGCAIKMEVEDE